MKHSPEKDQKRTVTIPIRIEFPDGRERLDEVSGRTAHHALWEARDQYRGQALVYPLDPADR